MHNDWPLRRSEVHLPYRTIFGTKSGIRFEEHDKSRGRSHNTKVSEELPYRCTDGIRVHLDRTGVRDVVRTIRFASSTPTSSTGLLACFLCSGAHTS